MQVFVERALELVERADHFKVAALSDESITPKLLRAREHADDGLELDGEADLAVVPTSVHEQVGVQPGEQPVDCKLAQRRAPARWSEPPPR